MINPRDPDYTNTPAGERRPEYGYAPADAETPLASIITPYFNVGPVFRETVRCVGRMSFPYWEWLIVDDGSTDEESIAQLAGLAEAEPRVRVLRQANGGPAVARNHAVREARGRYLLQLDADDLVEPTFLEKALWVLETQPQFAACTGYNVTFGRKPLLWPYGFQQYEENYYDNKNTTQAVIRRDAWLAAGGYDERISYEHADWDFWLTLADAGLWGYTIAEYLTWYRTQERSLVVQIESDTERAYRFRRWLHEKHHGLRSRFPHPEWKRNATPISETPPAQAPFANPLTKPAGVKRVLLVAPWMEMGVADKANLDLLRLLGCEGYQFTLATTAASADPWMHRFAALTPDVFALPRFLDCAEYPRFLAYLIKSRQIDIVLVSNSEFAHALVPFLRARFPHLTIVNLSHMEEEHWQDGARAALSPRPSDYLSDYLDAQMTCTERQGTWVIARDADPEHQRTLSAEGWQRVEVTSFDSATFGESMSQELEAAERRAAARPFLPGAESDARASEALVRATGELERLRQLFVAQTRETGDESRTLTGYARRLRERYFAVGSERYARYRRIRRPIARSIHLAISLPRYIRTGKIRAVPAVARAYLSRPLSRSASGPDSSGRGGAHHPGGPKS